MIDWLLSNPVTGTVTWVGTIFGLIGLAFTFWQAKGARDASEESLSKVRSLEERLSLANLAHSYSQVEAAKQFIQSERFIEAQLTFHLVKRSIIEVCIILGSNGEKASEVATVRKNIKLIEKQIDLGLASDSSYRREKLVVALAGLSDFLVNQENLHKFSR